MYRTVGRIARRMSTTMEEQSTKDVTLEVNVARIN